MCKLMEELTEELYKEELAEGRAKAKAEGKAEGRLEAEKNTLLENIRNAMESWGLTAEAAMKGLKISEDKQKELLPLI